MKPARSNIEASKPSIEASEGGNYDYAKRRPFDGVEAAEDQMSRSDKLSAMKRRAGSRGR